jgi:hypothetical protein
MHSEFFTQWGLTGNFKEKAESTYDKGWAHIGRFYWGLGVLENSIDEILAALYDFNHAAFVFLKRSNIDLKTKLQLVRIGRDYEGHDDSKLLTRVHELCHKLNRIVDRAFVVDEHAIDFDFIESRRRYDYPEGTKRATLLASEKRSKKHPQRKEYLRRDTAMAFFWFDHLDKEMAEVWDELEHFLDGVTPITDIGPSLEWEVNKTIVGR